MLPKETKIGDIIWIHYSLNGTNLRGDLKLKIIGFETLGGITFIYLDCEKIVYGSGSSWQYRYESKTEEFSSGIGKVKRMEILNGAA